MENPVIKDPPSQLNGKPSLSGFQFYRKINTNKKRFFNSAIPYLIRLLNMNIK